MNMVYELKHKKRSVLFGILLILGIVAGLILFTFLMYLLQELTGFGYMFYVEFILLIIFAIYYSRTKLIEFTYYHDGDILRIDRIYSKRPKLDLFIRMDKVAFMGKYKNLPEAYKGYKKQKETFKALSGEAFCVVHMVESTYFTAILSPSEDFEENTIKAWREYTYKSKKSKNK
jgi:hypothetical protein